jgi:hypothetical protein
MKTVKLALVFVFCINWSTLFSQTNNFPKIMYVTAREGFNQRAEPSINSEKVGALLFGQRVIVDRQGPEETIGEITDYWYGIHYPYQVSGREPRYWWVFGGYLSEEFPLDAPVILGLWVNPERIGAGYRFDPDGYYSLSIIETGNAIWGRWYLSSNVITITLTHSNLGGILESINETINITLTEVDKNNIVLNYLNGEELILTRFNPFQ